MHFREDCCGSRAAVACRLVVLVLVAATSFAEGATITSCPPPEKQFPVFQTTACQLGRVSVPTWATTFAVGTVARITCALGYAGADGEPVRDTATCQPDGRWLRAGADECSQRKCGTLSEPPRFVDGLMQNGTPTTVLDNPWHVAIYTNASGPDEFVFVCGGTILTERLVITASHCFWDKTLKEMNPMDEFVVAVGKNLRSWTGKDEPFEPQRIAVAAIHADPNYREYEGRFYHDVAVLVLDTAIVFKRQVTPICMDYDVMEMKRALVPGTTGRVAGWGLTRAGGFSSENLLYVHLPIVGSDECGRSFNQSVSAFLIDDKFCGGYTNGTSLCFGDSGGGWVFGRRTSAAAGTDGLVPQQHFYLGGIVSNGPGCSLNYNYFSTISHFHDLIFEAASATDVKCPRYVAAERLGVSCTDAGADCATLMRPGERWPVNCRTAVCGPDGRFVYLGQPCPVEPVDVCLDSAAAGVEVECCEGGVTDESCAGDEWCEMLDEWGDVCGDDGAFCVFEECS